MALHLMFHTTIEEARNSIGREVNVLIRQIQRRGTIVAVSDSRIKIDLVPSFSGGGMIWAKPERVALRKKPMAV